MTRWAVTRWAVSRWAVSRWAVSRRAVSRWAAAALRHATEAGVPRRSLAVALVVGTVLNLINQGDALLGLGAGPVNWFKVALTYVVPYGVATYGAVSMRMAAARGAG